LQLLAACLQVRQHLFCLLVSPQSVFRQRPVHDAHYCRRQTRPKPVDRLGRAIQHTVDGQVP
jgi:hypothetical protein